VSASSVFWRNCRASRDGTSPIWRRPARKRSAGIACASVVWASLLGLIANKPTLRDVETQTARLNVWGRTLVPESISDTTLHTELQRLDDVGLRAKLIAQVRGMHRKKRLRPLHLPCGVATMDGKNLATLQHDAAGSGHKRTQETDKWAPKDATLLGGAPYWLMPALRVTLTSAEAKPCIYQQPLEPGQGEETAAPDVVRALHEAYGRSGLVEVMDFDAGFTSLALAHTIDELGYAYVFGLKANQPTLYGQARRALRQKADTEAPEAQTPWERRNGRAIRRSLYRTDALLGTSTTAGRWDHLRQAWLVRQETRDADGTILVEDRYFISSLLSRRLRPEQILVLVRGHWGVENDTFNSLDLQWREDQAPWCTQGRSIWVLGWLRIMAYNVVQLLRRRTLRRKSETPCPSSIPTWRNVFALIAQAMLAPLPSLQPVQTLD
jgi:hypothetical protein